MQRRINHFFVGGVVAQHQRRVVRVVVTQAQETLTQQEAERVIGLARAAHAEILAVDASAGMLEQATAKSWPSSGCITR